MINILKHIKGHEFEITVNNKDNSKCSKDCYYYLGFSGKYCMLFEKDLIFQNNLSGRCEECITAEKESYED